MTARFRFEPPFPAVLLRVVFLSFVFPSVQFAACLVASALEPPLSKELPGIQPCVVMPRAGRVSSRLKREGWGTGVIEVEAAFEPNQALCRRSHVN